MLPADHEPQAKTAKEKWHRHAPNLRLPVGGQEGACFTLPGLFKLSPGGVSSRPVRSQAACIGRRGQMGEKSFSYEPRTTTAATASPSTTLHEASPSARAPSRKTLMTLALSAHHHSGKFDART